MKFISFDGIDKSGKTTLINAIFKITNGTVIIADRSPSSWHFLNVLLGRVSKNDKVYNREYKKKIEAYRHLLDLAVVLTVNKTDWQIRCYSNNEPPLVGNLPFEAHQRELVKHFDKAKYPNVLRLNTSELSEEECINLILKRLGIKEKFNASKTKCKSR